LRQASPSLRKHHRLTDPKAGACAGRSASPSPLALLYLILF